MNVQEEQEQIIQIPESQPPFKTFVIPTYATQTLSPANLNFGHFANFSKAFETPKTDVDISLDEEIFKANAEMLRAGVFEYFKLSLKEKFHQFDGNFNITTFGSNQNMEDDDQESIVELITSKNKLLSHETQVKFCSYIRQFPQIRSLFKELKPLVSSTILQQLSFIMYHILTLKLQSFKQLQENEVLELIPQIDRFWVNQQKIELLPNGWQVYQDVDYAKIKKFSDGKIEDLASKLYYAPQLRWLNFKQIQIGENDVSAKFSALVCFCAENLFLTMKEMRQEKEDLLEFQQELRMQIIAEQVQFEHPAKHTKLQ